MKQALLYCRVSTEEQSRRNVANLPTQEKKCRDHCERQLGVGVLRVFVDKESARSDDRKAFQAMLKFARKYKELISHVVIADLSRLARNNLDQATTMTTLTELGITLVSVDEPQIDNTAAGKLSANLLGSVNQYHSDTLSERVRYRMAEAVKSGRFVHRAPLGYRNVQNNGNKNLVVDPDRAPMVRKAFELLATGSYKTNDVLDKINAMGLRTVRGAPLTPQSFSQMIRNPIYKGWIHSGELKVKGNFEAIVSEELFITVQDVLDGKRVPVPHKRVSEDFPLRGFVRCAACNKPLTSGWARGRHNKRYARYWCWTKGCNAVGIGREGLESHFVSLLAMMQPTAELIAKLPDIARSSWEQRKKRIEDEQRQLQARMNEEVTLNRKAVAARLRDEMTKEDFDDLKKFNLETRSKLQEQLDALKSERCTMESMMAEARVSVMNLAKHWLGADLARRQELQNSLFPEGLVFSNEHLLFEPGNKTLMSGIHELLSVLDRYGNEQFLDGRGERI